MEHSNTTLKYEISDRTLLVVDVEAPDGSVRRITFEEGIVHIGRFPGEPLQLVAGNVSGRHALLWTDGEHVFVSDNRSTNGTWVCGERLLKGQIRELAPDDEVRIGAFLLRAQTPHIGPTRLIYGVTVQRCDSTERRSVTITTDEARVGRSPRAEVCLNDLCASRVHAVLTLSGGRVTVRDLGFGSGVFVRGARVVEHMLSLGESFHIGEHYVTLGATRRAP